ncbi:hypothetical protein RWK44_07880 [Rhizobium sp. 25PS6]|uniref:hypothetical protein n=1 Tax=Rhizobium sp. 25PS6 TaxID=3075622 RepID=UPI0028FD4D0D|nr:hypothetical protein [Rhizobium sp. 25PS6]MDU0360328.1 hypothetical protein [Rhizobium sp. 25PS6]
MKWIAGLFLALTMCAVAHAQEAPRSQTVDDLVRLLQDPEVRSWLKKAPGPPSIAAQEVDAGLATWEVATRRRIDGVVQAIPRIPGEFTAAASGTRADALSQGKLPVFVVSPRLTAAGLFAERMFARSRRRAEGLQERLLAIGVSRRPWARSSSLSTPKKTAVPRIAFKSDWRLEAPGALRTGRAAGKVVIDVA